jgi:hypothetical protein
MKLTGLIRASVLISLFGTAALIYAQDPKPQDEPRPEATRPEHDEAKPPARQEENAKAAKQAEHAQHADTRHDRIPDDKFRAHFGRQHTLVINRTTIVEGRPRFQYSGYWFTIVDPWPVGWAYSDQCYIDYVDGEYFLFDLLHPGVRIAIDVVL